MEQESSRMSELDKVMELFWESLDQIGCNGDVRWILIVFLDVLCLYHGASWFSGNVALVEVSQSHQAFESKSLVHFIG